MKRKLFVFAIAALSVCVMASCGKKDSSKENAEKANTENVESEPEETDEEDVAPKTEEGVIAMLQEAYADANLVSQPEDDMEPNIDLFGEYCSKSFNEKLNRIREIDADKEWGAKYELLKDELGQFIYWEGSTVEMKDIDVTIDGDTANATYLLTNGEDELMTEVELVYEDGQWHINNWLQIGMMALDVQENMDEYIQENQ